MKGFFPAKVINNNDTKKKGRVQIKIEYLHYNIADDFLPWAIQSHASIGSTDEFGSSFIPENNSFVWVWFEDIDEMYRQPYYICDVHFSNKHPHNLFEDNIKSPLGSASVYPNTKYTYYPNGICIGVDSSTDNPEIFLYHPSANIFIDKDGKVKITAVEIESLAGGTPSESSILGETLKGVLDAILDELALTTVTNPETGSPVPINNAANFTIIKNTQVPTILSPNIKNN